MKVAFLLAFGAAALVACSFADPNDTTTPALPDRDQFKTSVSPFMEQRCGALDCHGALGRPLRLYSQNGLRYADLDSGKRDTSPTTPTELTKNYFAVVGLEPEDLGTDSALLLQKPLDISGGGVRHKGGPVLRKGDEGYVCLASWLAGQVDVANCATAQK